MMILNYVLFANCDHLSYEKTTNDDYWVQVMDEEIHAIEKNETWELTILPKERNQLVLNGCIRLSISPMER